MGAHASRPRRGIPRAVCEHLVCGLFSADTTLCTLAVQVMTALRSGYRRRNPVEPIQSNARSRREDRTGTAVQEYLVANVPTVHCSPSLELSRDQLFRTPLRLFPTSELQNIDREMHVSGLK